MRIEAYIYQRLERLLIWPLYIINHVYLYSSVYVMFQGFNAAWIVKYSERNLWGEMYKTSLYYALNNAVIGDDDNFQISELQKAVRLRDECLRVKSVSEAKQAWVNYENFCEDSEMVLVYPRFDVNKSLYTTPEEEEEWRWRWGQEEEGKEADRGCDRKERNRRNRRKANVNDELNSIIVLLLIPTNAWYVSYIPSPHAKWSMALTNSAFLFRSFISLNAGTKSDESTKCAGLKKQFFG